MDLATATNAPEEITLGGKTYRVRLLTMRERGIIQAFLKSRLQSPNTRAAIAIQQAKDAGTPLDRPIEDRIWERAEMAALTWPPRFGSAAWFDAVDGIEGGWEQVLFEVLSKVDLDFTLDKAGELAPSVTMDEWADLIRVAFWGTPPAPKKADASPTTASPSGTTGGPSSAPSSSGESTPPGSPT
jgi:hypothetical protein